MAPRDRNIPSGESSPSRNPKAQRAGWRSSASRPQYPDAAVAATRSWWNVRRSEPARNVGMRFKLTTLVVLLACLVVGFIIFLREKPMKVPLIALAATYGGSSSLPPNAWAFEDSDRFERQFSDSGATRRWFGSGGSAEVDVIRVDKWGTLPGRLADNAIRQLEKVLRESPASGPGNAVVVYVSAHGVVNREGEPCLLLQDSSPLDAASWLPVDQVCKKFCQANPGAVHKKVLVLDCNRLEYDAPSGLLYNSFADELKDLVENKLDKKECAGLVVFNSASPGEIGWSAPERAASVFG